MSKEKNTRLVSALNHAAALVGERQSQNDMGTGLGLTLQRDRCLEEVRTITDGLFRVVIMGTFTSGKRRNALTESLRLWHRKSGVAMRMCLEHLTQRHCKHYK